MPTLLEQVIDRLDAQCAALSGRLHGVADLSALIAEGALPPVMPAAYVLPLGLRPLSRGDAAAGLYRQALMETIAVLLAVEAAGDVTAAAALPAVDALIEDVLSALAGWGPQDAIGVCEVERGTLVSAARGIVLYQIDFGLQRQLRVGA